MSQRYDVQGNALDIGVRAGVALFPRHGREPDTLLKASERAVLEAKIQQSEYVLFDPSWE
jgi:predicted signal transduction protein with EAL and GGDEF domain